MGRRESVGWWTEDARQRGEKATDCAVHRGDGDGADRDWDRVVVASMAWRKRSG